MACLFYVPYLGRFGITIHSRVEKISIETITSRFLDKNILNKLSVYKKEGTLFLKNRYSYHTLRLGPCVCAVRIMEYDSSKIIVDVKMCPLLSSLFIFGVLRAIIAVIISFNTIEDYFDIFSNIFVFGFLMYIYYKTLITRIEKICLR
jgi:hypothetical protein